MKNNAASRKWRVLTTGIGQWRPYPLQYGRHLVHSDAFQRRTSFWIPPVELVKAGKEQAMVKAKEPAEHTTQLLTNAGYLRQAYAGIFHMLPLGLRVQNKIERLIDKHMVSIGASKASLSSISSQDLWEKSGRLASGTEFFKFKDRKDAKFLLSPTHEEEITSLVRDAVQSPKHLPVRVYQVSRKYRDERRPRGGLLRGREFLMKDLYTFDMSEIQARKTYDAVRAAYAEIFNELRVDFLEAKADSGNMGGSLSHEFHFPHASGEDTIIHCSSCGYARNEELIDDVEMDRITISSPYTSTNVKEPEGECAEQDYTSWTAITTDHTTLVRAYAPNWIGNSLEPPPAETCDFTLHPPDFNTHAIKAAFPKEMSLNTGIESPANRFFDSINANGSLPATQKRQHHLHYVFDGRIDRKKALKAIEKDFDFLQQHQIIAHANFSSPGSPNALNLLKWRKGDQCPNCEQNTLDTHKAIEVGHTFHLGTRYSSKLGAKVVQPETNQSTAIEMGCHGIGVSRLIAAVAACRSDGGGLNWPRAIAPFQVVIVAKHEKEPEREKMVIHVAEKIVQSDPDGTTDVLYDDRDSFNLGWKMNDADAIGYPVMVVFGSGWFETDQLEVQCRQLDVKTKVSITEVPAFVQKLLSQL